MPYPAYDPKRGGTPRLRAGRTGRTGSGRRATNTGAVFRSRGSQTPWQIQQGALAVAGRPSAAGMNQQMQQAAGAGLGGGGYDVSSDPAVAAARGLAAKMRAQAQASALARVKQAAIEYGDPTGVKDPTKKGGELDEGTLKAARENPFSIVKNLEHGYSTGKADLEEALNKSNLFYSGYRGQQLGEAARGYQDSRYQASTRFKGLLTDIGDNLANALMNADMYEASALLGSSGGAYGGGGGDGGGGGYAQSPYSIVSAARAPRPSYSYSLLSGLKAPRPRPKVPGR